MMRLFKKRRQNTFRDGLATGFRTLFRNWLSHDSAGICRNRRSKHPEKRATESMAPLDSIAPEKPGDIDLYLTLKKRSEQTDSDKTKAVQE